MKIMIIFLKLVGLPLKIVLFKVIGYLVSLLGHHFLRGVIALECHTRVGLGSVCDNFAQNMEIEIFWPV